MKETWKPLYKFENYYEVSNSGRLRTIERVVIKRNGARHTVKQKMLKEFVNDSGYCQYRICVNGTKYTIKSHRAVMCSFFGYSELQVNHIDGDKSNNKIRNLEYVTAKENVLHANKNGLIKRNYGVNNTATKYTDRDIMHMRSAYKAGISKKSICEAYNGNYRYICDLISGRAKRFSRTY